MAQSSRSTSGSRVSRTWSSPHQFVPEGPLQTTTAEAQRAQRAPKRLIEKDSASSAFSAALRCALVLELDRELHDSRAAPPALGYAADEAAGRGVELPVRKTEVRVVGDVEDLVAELEIAPLLEAEVLRQREIRIARARAFEDVSPSVAELEGAEAMRARLALVARQTADRKSVV